MTTIWKSITLALCAFLLGVVSTYSVLHHRWKQAEYKNASTEFATQRRTRQVRTPPALKSSPAHIKSIPQDLPNDESPRHPDCACTPANQVSRGDGRNLQSWPAAAEVSRLQSRLTAWQQYGRLIRDLALSEEDANRFIEIVASGQLKGGASTKDTEATSPSPWEKVLEGKLSEVLGPGNLAKYKEYNATLRNQAWVNSMASQLNATGAPLTEQQREELLLVLNDDWAQLGKSEVSALEGQNALNGLAEWQLKRHERLKSRLRTFLSHEQMNYVEDYFEMISFTQRAIAETAEERAMSGGTSAEDAPTLFPTD